MNTKPIVAAELYEQRFASEQEREYPEVDRCMLRYKLTEPETGNFLLAARTLACPVKENPPCWQHGRLVHGLAVEACARAKANRLPHFTLMDIGTAKGFSALMMQWALDFSGVMGGKVISTDVIDPYDKVRRNTVAEALAGRWLTLRETLQPWPESEPIVFWGAEGVEALRQLKEAVAKIPFAFVDGKHTHEAVSKELGLIAGMQSRGDVILIDDLQVQGVRRAFAEIHTAYELETVIAIPNQRVYGVARKR
jgi:predicted O-methyltransferase YrrM